MSKKTIFDVSVITLVGASWGVFVVALLVLPW